VYSEDLFLEKHPFLGNAYLFRKFQAIYVRKKIVTRSPVGQITAASFATMLVKVGMFSVLGEKTH